MNRLFKDHLARESVSLDGAWKFLTDKDAVGFEKGWQNGLPEGQTVIVPSVWNNELGLLTYEGLGWYEKKFITTGGTLNFMFESVMTAATVWLDGVQICYHYGAFTPFEAIVKDVAKGEHTLVVCADNRFDEIAFPQRYTDWHNYGGIARSVSVDTLKGISILSSRLVYELSADLKSATAHAELRLYNAEKAPTASTLCVTLNGDKIYEGDVCLEGYEASTFNTTPVTIENISLWDTEAPTLYDFVVKTETDDLIEKVGFRKIEAKDNKILLNGKSIELLGVNRHEEHPEWGFAFPPKLMKKDLDLIRDLGCNTIRGSHYPNSKIFLDMLDRDGILFWSEIPMWGVGMSKEMLHNDDFIERGYKMHQEMTKYYYNHPSIIIWGMHNELYAHFPRVLDFSKKYCAHLRTDGGNRLITHAANHPFEDETMEIDDIICLNLYHGWYWGELADWDKLVVDFEKHLKNRGWYGKPVIMSEFGAGALAGFHSHFDNIRWSEEFQRDLLEYCLELFHKTDYMCGTYIWQFCNIRTSPTLELNRARCFNNKGILDEYRNPKAAYFKVKELYHKYKKETK